LDREIAWAPIIKASGTTQLSTKTEHTLQHTLPHILSPKKFFLYGTMVKETKLYDSLSKFWHLGTSMPLPALLRTVY
jgi:hypothetical protein